jgi:hypothetical protein
MLHVVGMKTESEFSDVYLDFIRQHGNSFPLQRDNATLEISQSVQKLINDLDLADQQRELYSSLQNAAVLNVVKYFESHGQVLLHIKGAPDYFAHVHNLIANLQIHWKISEQVSKG